MPASSAAEELFWSARHGRMDALKAFLARGLPVDWRYPLDGRTALAAAAVSENVEVSGEDRMQLFMHAIQQHNVSHRGACA